MRNINYIKKRPKDYHCTCKYCKLFKGELRKEDGAYYSARKREGYSLFEKAVKHLCAGHAHGYKFVIENYTRLGQTVLDPFSGTGTAMIEAMKLGRKAIGIELEYSEITKKNLSLYPKKQYKLIIGDSLKKINEVKNNSVDLIVTGPPYNQNSDRPERKNLTTKEDNSFNYKNEKNLAFLSDNDYEFEMQNLFIELYNKLKSGGIFATIIKDPIRKKKPYLLHTLITKIAEDVGFIPQSIWIHKHWPPTLFISTYAKRFPKVKVPRYQTIVIMTKK